MADKVITLAELREHTTKDNLWVLLHGNVYDVTKFIDEHPGGDEVILAEAGKNATEAFEDVGHSDEARALLPGMRVGEFEKGSKAAEAESYPSTGTAAEIDKVVEQTSNVFYFVPLAAIVAYFAWRFYS